MKVESESEVAQSCPTLIDPMDCSPPGYSMGFSRQEYWSGLPLPSPVKEPMQFQIIVQGSPVGSLLVVPLSGFGPARVPMLASYNKLVK